MTLDLATISLFMMCSAKAAKVKVDKWDHIKLKTSAHQRTQLTVKMGLTGREEMFTNFLLIRG